MPQDNFQPLWSKTDSQREHISATLSRKIRPYGLSSLVALHLDLSLSFFPGSQSLREYTTKQANSHALFMSLYTQYVTFGIAQIYIVTNTMYIFLLRCSSCSAGSSWLRYISPEAHGPGPHKATLCYDVCPSCFCEQLPPVVLHQCPLSLQQKKLRLCLPQNFCWVLSYYSTPGVVESVTR